jgi:hypothetical protein
VDHGAPLRLLVPVKLGLKNVKAITKITYSVKEQKDYWAERGYSRYDGILQELRQAAEAKVSVAEWEDWLRGKGLVVRRYQPGEEYTLPCAHLVIWAGQPHWIYQAKKVFTIQTRSLSTSQQMTRKCWTSPTISSGY